MKQVKMSNKVYTKDFNVKSLGYCCEEVDAFLDEINMEIVRLEREIEDLNANLLDILDHYPNITIIDNISNKFIKHMLCRTR